MVVFIDESFRRGYFFFVDQFKLFNLLFFLVIFIGLEVLGFFEKNKLDFTVEGQFNVFFFVEWE